MSGEELHKKYHYFLVGMCRKYAKNEDEFEDMYQHSCVVMLEAYKKYDKTRAKFMTMLYYSIRNALINYVNKRNLVKGKRAVLQDVAVSDELCLWELTPEMSDLEELIFNLKAEGRTNKSIAEMLDIPYCKFYFILNELREKIESANTDIAC